jgi:hypothetical protein
MEVRSPSLRRLSFGPWKDRLQNVADLNALCVSGKAA